MLPDTETHYRALSARDSRFDGVFFVGVTTTGIYCRPVCPARTPRSDRCRFFPSAAGAEREGFRPCLRCRPELAPGLAPVDANGRTARLAAARIEAGALNREGGLERLASELGLSSRQLRRAVRREFGVSPVELAQTGRLLLAKQLLADSDLPIIRVAFASGFESVRRFNAAFRAHYRLTPTQMRRARGRKSGEDCIRLTLGYRPPLAWREMLTFLAGRASAGVEGVEEAAYLRTVAIGSARGWLKAEAVSGRDAIAVEVSTSLISELPAVLGRVRHLFDLNARPDIIAAHLSNHPCLAPRLALRPGLRVPGAFDGFELAVRAILGQRISVRAATTLAGRLAKAFGEPFETPFPGLDRLSPTAERIAEVETSDLVALGIRKVQAECLRALATAVLEKRVDLEVGHDPQASMDALKECPGIGEWTAQYIAMRALRWPDAFPHGDLALLKASGASSARALTEASEAWRPWRSYAAMALWQSPDPHDETRSES